MINTIDFFAETIKSMIENFYGHDNNYTIKINKVTKNNGLNMTGITIHNEENNITPVIYLDRYFMEYKNGKTIDNICNEIVQVYEKNKVQKDFSIEQITDFNNVKNKICFKLVNRKKNAELLTDAPYVEYQDLAIIFYILVSKEKNNVASITIRNAFMNMWNVDVKTLYHIAKKNTQRLFKGAIETIAEIISNSTDTLDEDIVKTFFDTDIPMYVATNVSKLNGACIILYDGVLKKFAEKIGSDFYILPSSVHEMLFVPVNEDMDARCLIQIVKEVNATGVLPDEVLSDNVYMYHADKDFISIV